MSRRISPLRRVLRIRSIPNPMTGSSAAFLWGPRQTGKTTLVKQQYEDAAYYDLLDTDLLASLTVRPATLREQILADGPEWVVIDEIQKVPALLQEVHWLLENTSTRFVLCGSSARKLRREADGLLGGRAVENELFPLTTREIPELDLDRMLRHGGLPSHYLVGDPGPLLSSYVNTYIKQEIVDESLTRNVPAFSRFLQIVGLTHGRQLNYANVARESGVSANTVRSYYQILVDTLLGFHLEPWRRRRNRRLVETAKFYLFDIGIANHLDPDHGRGADRTGRSFEHFIINEVRAFLSYNHLELPLSYWRTSSGFEVDLVIDDMRTAIEIKSTTEVTGRDLKGLRALMSEHHVENPMVVARVQRRRRTEDGITILPWQDFCTDLWEGEIAG